MKLSLSNLAYLQADKLKVHRLLMLEKYKGLEIAPRLFVGENPYDLPNAPQLAADIAASYGLCISSMQSIWYGMAGNIFDKNDAQQLEAYTSKAIDFAASLGCHNIVFGCPKNRLMAQGAKDSDVVPFFSAIAAYAHNNGVNIALEANPECYGTNFINTTREAFDFAKNIKYLRVNYDLGTDIINGDSLNVLSDNINMVSHVHISEPNLACICQRSVHKELACLLREKNYEGFVSIEMKSQPLAIVQNAVSYIREVFC